MVARALAAGVARRAVQKAFPMPHVERVPEGRVVELPGRGSTFVVDVPGPDGAPTIVLLHALGCTGYLSWHPVLEKLAQDHRVVVLDQRWHGRGIRSSRFRLEDCADDLAALLDVLGVDSCIPVGYSMGGAVAQLFWNCHPELVDGLVLCSTARNVRGTRKEKVFFPVVEAAVTGSAGWCATRVEKVARRLPGHPGTASAGMQWGRQEFRSTSAWTTPAVLAAIGRFDSAAWIGEVDVPTAVLVTTRDRTIPVRRQRRQRRLAASIPGAQVVEVDAGHAAIVLAADRFRPALRQALASVVARVEADRPARVG